MYLLHARRGISAITLSKFIHRCFKPSSSGLSDFSLQKAPRSWKLHYSCCCQLSTSKTRKEFSVKDSMKFIEEKAEEERLTFADTKPIELDSNCVLTIFQRLQSQPNYERKYLGTSHRLSDDFLLSYTSDLLKPSTNSSPTKTIDPYDNIAKRWFSSTASPSEKQNENKGDSAPEKEPNSNMEDDTPKSKTAQLRKIFAIYGSFGVAFHIFISLISVGICYLIVSSGVDVVGLLKKMGIEMSTVTGSASTMVVAYAVHKLILPLRASITIISVPVMVRYLRKLGYLKK